MANLTGRDMVRAALQNLHTNALVAGNVVAAAYDRMVTDFQGQSPVVVIGHGTSERERTTFKSPCGGGIEGWKHTFRFDIFLFVKYSDEAGSWTDAQAEVKLDQTETADADLVAENNDTADWDGLNYDDPSEAGVAVVSGWGYKRERIPVRIEVFQED